MPDNVGTSLFIRKGKYMCTFEKGRINGGLVVLCTTHVQDCTENKYTIWVLLGQVFHEKDANWKLQTVNDKRTSSSHISQRLYSPSKYSFTFLWVFVLYQLIAISVLASSNKPQIHVHLQL
ncbi:hypothetical protein L1887_13740 [Cichorium endivia]|nr:hypothetical protein L1887_13740 [Cichorium endivia]